MCKFFEVSRSGYYSFVKRIDNPAKDLELAKLVQACQQESKHTYGYRRVTIWLERNGVHRNPKTVLRVMRKYGLLSVVRRKRYIHYSQGLHRYSNILDRNFTSTRPNEKWATDISYIPTKQGFVFLSIIRDLYDNSIVAYKTSTRQTVNLVLETIKEARQKEMVTETLYIHSDQGFQYTSNEYFKLTQEYGITPSMSRRGNPYDNALAENFFSILKSECINRTNIETYAEAKDLIDEYIYFYNYQRIQTKTKLTPLEKRRQYIA